MRRGRLKLLSLRTSLCALFSGLPESISDVVERLITPSLRSCEEGLLLLLSSSPVGSGIRSEEDDSLLLLSACLRLPLFLCEQGSMCSGARRWCWNSVLTVLMLVLACRHSLANKSKKMSRREISSRFCQQQSPR